jgi:hypothetical protein
MTIRYLKEGTSKVISGLTGAPTLTLTPPVGQFWLPRLLRVGVNVPSLPSAPLAIAPLTCTIFHGGFNDFTPSAFVDATANGSQDVTGIMNGTLIQATEYLSAQWFRLDILDSPLPAGTVGYFEILGLSADTMAEVSLILAGSSPGSPFASRLPNPSDIPIAGEEITSAVYTNPGQNNRVDIILSSNGLEYLYNLTCQPFQTGTGAEGGFVLTGDSNTPNTIIAPVNPFSYIGPYIWDFNGFRSVGGGLSHLQTGNAAMNTVSFRTSAVTRFQFF